MWLFLISSIFDLEEVKFKQTFIQMRFLSVTTMNVIKS